MAGRGRKKLVGPVNYFELPRKQLQSLCKKHGFPANKTNHLMAEFLAGHLSQSVQNLNRDGESLDSPAVKTNYDHFSRSRHSETIDCQHPTKVSLPTVSEPQPLPASGTSPLHGFANDAAQIDGMHVDAVIEETDLSDKNIQKSPEKSRGISEPKDSTLAGSSTPESSQQSHSGSSRDTPLPLSVMPYVCAVSPSEEFYVSNDCGVKLAVDLNNDRLPKLDLQLPGDNHLNVSISGDKRRDYQAWAGPATSRTDRMQDDMLGSFRTLRGTERNLPLVVRQTATEMARRWMEGPSQEEEIQQLLQGTTSSRTASLDASLFSAKSRSSLKVSFRDVIPGIFPPSRSTDVQLTDIVQGWGSNDKTMKTLVCKSTEQREDVTDFSNDHRDEDTLRHSCAVEDGEPSEHMDMERTQQFSSDMESPPEGIVKKVVQIYEEEGLSGRISSINRKDAYKSSPFVKSSRVAEDFRRASKLGQARREGILAARRAMGEPILSTSPGLEVERIIGDNVGSDDVAGSTIEVVMADDKPLDSSTFAALENVVATECDTILEQAFSSKTAVAAPLVSISPEASVERTVRASSFAIPLPNSIAEEVNADKISSDSVVAASECVAMVEGSPILSGSSGPPSGSKAAMVPLLEDGPELPGGNRIWSHIPSSTQHLDTEKENEYLVTQEDKTKDGEKMHELNDKNVQQNDHFRGAGAANLPAIADGSLNLPWMHKPIQLPIRKAVNPKLSKKIGHLPSAIGKESQLADVNIPREVCPGDCRGSSNTELIEIKENLDIHNKGDVKKVEKGDATCGEGDLVVSGEEEEAKTNSILDKETPQATVSGASSLVGSNCLVRSMTIGEKAVEEPTTFSLLDVDHPEISMTKNDERTQPASGVGESTAKEEETVEKPTALDLLDIVNSQNLVKKKDPGLPSKLALGLLDIDFTKTMERSKLNSKPIVLNWINSNMALQSSPNCSVSKATGVMVSLENLEESGGKENYAACDLHPNEKESLRRHEQHKAPLTGKSKEKALRTAEKKAANLREQLLRKRRGMEQTDEDLNPYLSPLTKQWAMTNRLF